MPNLPPDYQDTDPQSLFVAHAPFKWGQPDPPVHETPKQVASESSATDGGQQNPQTSTNLFEQKEQSKPSTTNIFAHLQQPSSSTQSPFGQQNTQQPQTPNMFRQQTASPFQTQSNQPVSSPFAHLSASQSQSSNNIFSKPATSPAKDGDSMSTTPDTSPQSNNDRGRYGPFASATAIPPPSMNGPTVNGSGGNLFNFASTPSSSQSVTSASLEGAHNESDGGTEVQDSANAPSDISLGSPKKSQGASSIRSRKVAQPTMGRPHIEEKKSASDPFAAISSTPSDGTSATHASAPNGLSNIFPNQSNASPNDSPQLFGNASTQGTEVSKPHVSREPGAPPPPPDDFTDEQKRQLITGWRLKCLDKGLQSYLEYSSYSEAEIESISTFYHLRKQAILEADGGPVKEINSKRAAARQAGPQSKRARHQPPSATSGQDSQVSRPMSTRKSNASKRKAVEELSKGNGQPSSDGMKRSRPEDQVVYPSLPSSSSSSQTAKMFGNLVGKGSDQGSSTPGDAASKDNPSRGIASVDVATSQAGFSGPSLFSQAPNSNPGSSTKQSPLFDFSTGPISTPSQPKSRDQEASSQSLSTQQSSPFKGFMSSQPGSARLIPPTSSHFPVTPSSFGASQPSNSASMFGNLNGDNSHKSNTKRKAIDSGGDEDSAEDGAAGDSDEQRSKKQRTEEVSTATTDSDKENNDSFKPQTTTGQIGFGDSIFSRPGSRPANTSNPFAHLAKHDESLHGSKDQEDDDADDDEAEDKDERSRKSSKGTKRTASDPKHGVPNRSPSNPFASPVINPFAASSFNIPKERPDEGNSAGRSLFDRIERVDKGQPKTPDAFKNIDLGQTFLTPKADRATGSNVFGATSQASGNSNPINTAASSTSETPAATQAFNLFGKPSGSSTAPVANMSSPKGTEDSPGGDHTWKAGTPVKFSGTSAAPSINFISPSPGKTPLTGLFGVPKTGASSEMQGSFIFKPSETSSTKPAPLTFGISAPPKALNDSLAPPSETQSESTSRATSPGGGESGNEASDLVHEEESHPALDATEASKAEADEDTIFDVKAKANKLTESKHFDATTGKDEISRKWVLQGLEQLRILKHRDTKKTRMLMKLKLNGRVILNTGLQESLDYELASAKTVRVPVPTKTKVESWTITFGKEADAKEFVRLLEENKAN